MKYITMGATLALTMGTASFAADCGPAGQSVRILASDFPAIRAVAGLAEENCAAPQQSSNATTQPKRAKTANAAFTPTCGILFR